MSYLLKVATIDIILSLHRRGWSQRRIARELDVNRETVARHLKHAKSAQNQPMRPPAPTLPSLRQNQPMRPPAPTALRQGRSQVISPPLRPRSLLTKAPVAGASASPGER